MKKLLLFLFLAVVCSVAQVSVGPLSLTSTGNTPPIGTNNQGTVVINVSGSWSGTIQPKGEIQGLTPFNVMVTPAASQTPQLTITANGAYVTSVAGLSGLLLSGNTVTGTAVIYMTASPAEFNPPGVTGGGSTSGLIITSAGTPAPSPLATASCPPLQGVYWYIKKADGTYQDVSSLDVTTVSNPSPPAGTINDCWRRASNDSGVAGDYIRNALISSSHVLGHGGLVNGVQENAIATHIEDTDPLFEHITQMVGSYNEAVIVNTPIFDGHASGETDISAVRGTMGDNRVAGAGGSILTGGSFLVSRSTSIALGSGGVYAGVYSYALNTNASAPATTTSFDSFFATGADIAPCSGTGCSWVGYHAQITSNKFANSNTGFESSNMGTGTNDFDYRGDGVNSSGTPAGFNYFTGPTRFGTALHATSGFQVDITGAERLTGNLNMTAGLLAQYDGITTAGLGVHPQVARVRAVGQTSAIGSATLFTTGAANTDYLVVVSTYCTTTSAAATVAPTITYTDVSSTSQTITPSAAVCTALGASSFDLINTPISVKTATNIQYSTAIANSPTYDIRVDLYQLGVD